MFSLLYAAWSLVHIFTEYLKLPMYGFLPWKHVWLSVQLQRSNSMNVNMQLFVGCLPSVTIQKVTFGIPGQLAHFPELLVNVL